MNRNQLEALVWITTHRDYKSSTRGVRSVLHFIADVGTCLVPLSQLTDRELTAKIHAQTLAANRGKYVEA